MGKVQSDKIKEVNFGHARRGKLRRAWAPLSNQVKVKRTNITI